MLNLIPQSLRPPLKQRFFAMSVNADRMLSGIADFPKGVWIEIPLRVYFDLGRAIAEGVTQGVVAGWQVKAE